MKMPLPGAGRRRPRCSSSWRRLRAGAGQGGLQGRQQGLQGGELQEGHRELRAGGRARPELRRGWFYLGSSHQALYRPGKDTPGEQGRTSRRRSSTTRSRWRSTRATTENLKKVKLNTLAALTAIYSDDPNGLRHGLQVRRAAGPENPERRQEPVRHGEPLREVRQGRRGGADVQEGRRAEPERPQGLRRPGRLLQQAAVGRDGGNRSKFDEAIDDPRALRQPRPPTTQRLPEGRDLLLGQGLPRPAAHRRAEGASTPTRAWRPWTRRWP